jgi:hypothetical protein
LLTMLAPLGLRSERTGANPCLSGRQAHRIGDYPFFESDPQLIRLRAGPSSQGGVHETTPGMRHEIRRTWRRKVGARARCPSGERFREDGQRDRRRFASAACLLAKAGRRAQEQVPRFLGCPWADYQFRGEKWFRCPRVCRSEDATNSMLFLATSYANSVWRSGGAIRITGATASRRHAQNRFRRFATQKIPIENDRARSKT